MRRPERRAGAAAVLACVGLVSLVVGSVVGPMSGAAAEETGTPSASSTPTGTATGPPTPQPTPISTPTLTPTPTSSTKPGGAVRVDAAVLRWGVSDQTNARSHNPAAINFLAAGVADPGRGGVQLKQSQWRARQGAVTVEKRTSSGQWATATWAGLATSPSGASIGVYGPFSDHTIVLRGGTGTVDRAAGAATISWRGTFTVVYYGGNTIFTVTDPALRVVDGAGTLTATLGGFLADRDDPRVWTPATPKRVRIADLPGVRLGARGLTATPAYAGVAVTGSEPQDRSGPGWGSFPQPFVSYLRPFNVDQFWYSTGLQSDSTKQPLPVTISYTAAEVAAPKPSATAPAPPEIENTAPPPPRSPTTTGQLPPLAGPTAPRGAPAAGPVPVVPGAPAVSTASSTDAAPPTPTQLVAASTEVGPARSPASRGWYVGGGLLILAALVLLMPLPRAAQARSHR